MAGHDGFPLLQRSLGMKCGQSVADGRSRRHEDRLYLLRLGLAMTGICFACPSQTAGALQTGPDRT